MVGDDALIGTGGGGIALDAETEAVDGNREGPGRGPRSGSDDSVSAGEAGIGVGTLPSSGV